MRFHRRWIKRSLFAVFGAAAIAGGVAACAHHEHGPRFGAAGAEDVARWKGRFVERAARELQLDDAQTQLLGALFDKVDAQRAALVGGADPRAAMQALIAGERFDRDRANALVGEKTDAVRSRSPEVISAAADFYDALRPGQQAKVRDFMQRRRPGRG